MDLGNCVNKLEGQIKTIAKASIWIGNDEIMKAAKELQTFKNTAEKKLPDNDIEEFHSNGLLQLNTTPPKPEYYVNSLIFKEIREIDYIVSKASKL